MMTIIYVLLAVLGLSFLIFIHELGHYFMARRVGMRVETFSIGFGSPIFSWKYQGVKWQIGWLPFGGYVKIAGTEGDKDGDLYKISDGFFGKSPFARIKVAFMGPFINILFALLVFSLLWVGGGREKNFSDLTSKIGWVDPRSELYAYGIRPGDEILEYDGHSFEGAKDHLYAPMIGSDKIGVKGLKVNYATGEKSLFELKVNRYPHPSSLEKGIMTAGITQSASYVMYDRLPGNVENPLPEGSPLQGSGIQYGDRILWVDGERVFSVAQLTHLLNDGRMLLTIRRGDAVMQARVPRFSVQEFKLEPEFKEELIDWQHEAKLNTIKFNKLYAIPYNLTNDCVVGGQLRFIDMDKEEEAFPRNPYSSLELPLQPGDRIIAVEGVPVKYAFQLLLNLQEKHVLIIVQREPSLHHLIPWQQGEAEFEKDWDWDHLKQIVQNIGTAVPVAQSGNLVLLKPVIPKTKSELVLSPEKQALLASELNEQKKEVETIEDPERREQILHLLENREKQLMLGLPGIQDRRVDYNPIPTDMFTKVFYEIERTFTALFSGTLKPKWISGPIGIVQVVQEQWKLGFNEALFWIGAISLNLGILNLLPIPLLDGGTIMFALFEMATGIKLRPKTMEKLILPFAILLIIFFVFLTYNDLSRLFGGFFHW